VSDDTVKLDEQTERLLDKVRFKRDPATGEAVPRDFSELSPTEAVEILRTLRDAAEFGKEPTSEASKLARKLYASLSEKIGEAMPDVVKLLNEETALIIARDAAQRMQEKYEAEHANVNALVYAGIAIALYLVSMAVGSVVVLAVGTAVTLFAFWRSALCMTSRAAFYSWLADMLAGAFGIDSPRISMRRRRLAIRHARGKATR